MGYDDDRFYYFAYGMNTCPQIMDRHDVCVPIGAAILEGYRLVFRYHASIEPGKQVYGVLWEVNADTLASISIQEGYPKYYDKFWVTVKCNGKEIRAITYKMNGRNLSTSLATLGPLPSQDYLRHILCGYKSFNIPLDQLHDALTEVPTN